MLCLSNKYGLQANEWAVSPLACRTVEFFTEINEQTDEADADGASTTRTNSVFAMWACVVFTLNLCKLVSNWARKQAPRDNICITFKNKHLK